MTRLLVAIIAVVVIGAGAFVAWTTLDDGTVETLESGGAEPDGVDEGETRTARRTADETHTPASAKPENVDAEGFEADPATAVMGRVVDARGAAVAGAELSLQIASNVSARGGPATAVIEASRTTGADGRFRLEGVPHGVPLALRARHPDLQDATASVRLRQGEERDVGDIVAEPGGSISGRVLAADGLPIPDASLRAYPAGKDDDDSPFALLRLISGAIETSRSVATDAAGEFRLAGLAPGRVRIVVSAGGHPPAIHDPVRVEAGRETTDVIVRMKPGHDLEVTVRTPEGAPVRGARVRLRSTGFDMEEFLSQIHGGQHGSTDAEGRFVLHGLDTRAYKVEVVEAGYFEKTVDVREDQTRAVVQLDRAGAVWGVVTAAHDGAPVPSFEIEVKGSHLTEVLRGSEAALAVATDEVPGLFAITGNTADHLSFVVKAEGFAHARRTLGDLGPDHVREDVALVLQVPFTGRVVDSDGEPVARARVTVSTASAGIDGGEYEKVLEEMERVRDHVSAMPRPRIRRSSIRTDVNGDFSIPGLEPGEVSIRAKHPLFLPSEGETMTLVAGEPVEGHEIVLSRGATLRGVVRGTDGSPMKGAVVTLDRARGSEAPDDSESGSVHLISGSTVGGGFKNAISEDDGSYEIHAIPPGSYRAKVEEPTKSDDRANVLRVVGLTADGPETGEPVTVNGEEVISLDLSIKPRARIVGTVTSAGGAVANVAVDARPKAVTLSLGGNPGAKSDAEGRFVIEDVKPGKYVVTARAHGSPSPVRMEIDVLPGADAAADFTLPGGVIRGRVIEASTGDGIGGVEVWARTKSRRPGTDIEEAMRSIRVAFDAGSGLNVFGGGDSHRIVTDEKGDYELPFVSAETYTVSCRHADFIEPVGFEAVVADGEVTGGVDFSLVLGGTLEVVIANPDTAGGPFAFNHVSVQRTGADTKPVHKTGMEPRVRFAGLEPGTYDVTVRSGKMKAQGTAVVRAGYAETLTLRVE